MKEINIQSSKNKEFIDITFDVQEQVPKDFNGAILIFSKHTTCAITINENSDPNVQTDMIKKLEQLSFDKNYKHFEGNSDAHILTSLTGNSELVPIEKGKLMLGRWQGIYLTEFDGPRTRTVVLTFLKS